MRAKIVILLLMISIVFIGAFALSACSDDLPDNSDGVEINLIVLDLDNTNVYEKKLSTVKSSLFEALDEFEGLRVISTFNDFDAYIKSVSVGTIDENEQGTNFIENVRLEGSIIESTYIAVYHDIDDILLKDLSPYDLDLLYAEKTYYYSGVNIKMLPLYNGATYMLKLAAY